MPSYPLSTYTHFQITLRFLDIMNYKIIIQLVNLGVDRTGDLVGHSQECGMVETVETEQHPQGKSLQDYEHDQRKEPADE